MPDPIEEWVPLPPHLSKEICWVPLPPNLTVEVFWSNSRKASAAWASPHGPVYTRPFDSPDYAGPTKCTEIAHPTDHIYAIQLVAVDIDGLRSDYSNMKIEAPITLPEPGLAIGLAIGVCFMIFSKWVKGKDED